MKVAIGAARGLTFLHDSKQQIIYRDFKASNILLDSVCLLNIIIVLPYYFWNLREMLGNNVCVGSILDIGDKMHSCVYWIISHCIC